MTRNRTKKPLGLSFETLERREVFAGLSGGLVNGVLTINGTTAADNISLTQTADVVRLDGYNASWNANAIKEIRINASGGNDTVRLAVNTRLAATFVGNGGSGQDTILTTAKPASLTGFEVGQLIAPPAGTQPVSTPAITVVKKAVPNVMPGQTVVYDRWTYDWGLRDDAGYTMGPSRVYSTEAEARAAAQQHIDSTRGNGYWAVTHVRITGEASIKGTATPVTSARDYALKIFNNSNIRLASVHSSGVSDAASAWSNMWDTAYGRQAARSSYGNAPGGTVALSTRLLNGMLQIAEKYSYNVSEIAGGSHAKNSLHYQGRAVDINYVNGVHVSKMSNSAILEFAAYATSLGAKVYGPHNEPTGHWNHFDLEW